MERIVQPEILDQLPSCHLDAMASRRDLLKINYLMGNFRWLRSGLKKDGARPEHRYLELGAGDGALARRLLDAIPSASYSALDLAPEPEGWPDSAQWLRQDLRRFEGFAGFTHLISNLFLHHFEADTLNELGARIAASPIRKILVCEPCRRPLHQQQLRAGKWIGFNHITLHDGSVSVEAGFRDDELPELLGLAPTEWRWTVSETLMGAYRMCATRL